MSKSTLKVIKKSRGRPRTGIGKLFGVRLSDGMIQSLDRWIAAQPERMSRPEAIRQLMSIGIADAMFNNARAAKKLYKGRLGQHEPPRPIPPSD